MENVNLSSYSVAMPLLTLSTVLGPSKSSQSLQRIFLWADNEVCLVLLRFRHFLDAAVHVERLFQHADAQKHGYAVAPARPPAVGVSQVSYNSGMKSRVYVASFKENSAFSRKFSAPHDMSSGTSHTLAFQQFTLHHPACLLHITD